MIGTYEPPEDIRKLRELTGSFHVDKSVKLFDTQEGGAWTVIGLKKSDGVGVVDSFVEDGNTFPTHEHSAYEWLIPYQGKMLVHMNGTKIMVGSDQETRFVVLSPGVKHKVTAVGDVRMIGVTVPADEGYPGAGRE